MNTWTQKASLFAVALVVAALIPAVAAANGRVTDYQKKTAGPYEVSLGTIPPSPSVGPLHFTMVLNDRATNTLVLGANVTVSGIGPDSNQIDLGPIAATNSIQDPSAYDVSTHVDREGIWLFTTTISDADGEHSAEFEISVKNARPLTGIVTLLVLVAFLVILGLSIRASFGQRRKPKKRRPA